MRLPVHAMVLTLTAGLAAAAPGDAPHPLLAEASRLVDGRATPRELPVPARARSLARELGGAGRPVPEYLALLGLEPAARAVFSMPCFWSGEVQLGELDGVAASRTGWSRGREVVEVTYDPATLAGERLEAAAWRRNCQPVRGGEVVVEPTPGDDKYHSRRPPWSQLPMIPAQASRVNAALARGQDPERFLSPAQVRLLDQIRAHPDAGWPSTRPPTDFGRAWARAHQLAATLAQP